MIDQTDDVREYVSRLRGLASGIEPVSILRATPTEVARFIEGLTQERVTEPPGLKKWSISQIVAHLADSEMVTSFRLRQILSSSDGVPIPSYDQDAWAAVCHYDQISVRDSLELFSSLRRSNLRICERLSGEQLRKYGMHAERGRESVQDLLVLIAGHDINHLTQIQAIAGS